MSSGKWSDKRCADDSTFGDKWDNDDILDTLESIAEELESDLKRLKYAGKTVTVKYKLHTFESECRVRRAELTCRQDTRAVGQAVH